MPGGVLNTVLILPQSHLLTQLFTCYERTDLVMSCAECYWCIETPLHRIVDCLFAPLTSHFAMYVPVQLSLPFWLRNNLHTFQLVTHALCGLMHLICSAKSNSSQVALQDKSPSTSLVKPWDWKSINGKHGFSMLKLKNHGTLYYWRS